MSATVPEKFLLRIAAAAAAGDRQAVRRETELLAAEIERRNPAYAEMLREATRATSRDAKGPPEQERDDPIRIPDRFLVRIVQAAGASTRPERVRPEAEALATEIDGEHPVYAATLRAAAAPHAAGKSTNLRSRTRVLDTRRKATSTQRHGTKR